ncbi:hypothetical protein NOVOSPHI9U_210022 [Novosphingobium sp. 9U]|nr:hypothetical protein NOVOSPHI9U_210022 [Novosphingobium sp. 9U]
MPLNGRKGVVAAPLQGSSGTRYNSDGLLGGPNKGPAGCLGTLSNAGPGMSIVHGLARRFGVANDVGAARKKPGHYGPGCRKVWERMPERHILSIDAYVIVQVRRHVS